MNRWSEEGSGKAKRFFGTDRATMPVAFTRSLVRRTWFARIRAAFAYAWLAFRYELAQEFEP